MEPRRDRRDEADRRLMEQIPQEPIAADPDEEGEPKRTQEDDEESEPTPA